MKNKLNIIIFILVVLCIIISVYLFFFSGGISNYHPTISLNQETIDLKIGEETVINPVITNLDDYTVLWTSSNESVVTVIDGKIRATNKGISIITAKLKDYDVSDSLTVIVNEIEPESIKLNTNTLELKVDDTYEFSYILIPDNTTNKEVKWEVSDESLLSVDDGKVQALKSGNVSIRVVASNGINDICDILIKDKDNKIHFIKQSIVKDDAGDAILLESNGKFAMVDTGLSTSEDNQFVYDYLESVGVKELEFILITHCHDDHIGGAVYLINSSIKVKKFYIKTYIGRDSNGVVNSKLYNNTISALNNKEIPIVYIDKTFSDGEGFTFGNMKIELYNTAQRMNEQRFRYGNENNNSVMELVKVNNYKVFLPGDSYNVSIMEEIVKEIGEVDVLKLPHHGYATCSLNTSNAQKLNPDYIIVTNGRIDACRKYFNNSIPTYYTRASEEDAIIVNLTDKIKIT